MPYLWLPAVDGKLRFGPPPVGGGSANVELDAGNYLDPGINQPGAAGNVGAPGVGQRSRDQSAWRSGQPAARLPVVASYPA